MAADGTNVAIAFAVSIPAGDSTRLVPSRIDFSSKFAEPDLEVRVIEPTMPIWRIAAAMFLLHSGDDGDHKVAGSIKISSEAQSLKSEFNDVEVIDNNDYSKISSPSPIPGNGANIAFNGELPGKFMCWLDTQLYDPSSSFQDPATWKNNLEYIVNKNSRNIAPKLTFNMYGSHSGIIHGPATSIVEIDIDPNATGSVYPFTDAPIIDGKWYQIDSKSGHNDGKWIARCVYNISYLPYAANAVLPVSSKAEATWSINSLPGMYSPEVYLPFELDVAALGANSYKLTS